MTHDVAIIGGGVSGLACAFDLKRQGHRVVVLERQANPGGSAHSERIGGFLMEHGPTTVNAGSAVANDFSNELELNGVRCDLGSGVRRRYLMGDGALRGISVHPLGFLLSGYLSVRGKLRLMREFSVPGAVGGKEETVAEFCSRRFGPEFVERVIDPLVAGIYAGRADELSVSAVFPKLVELERKYGAITPGLMRRRKRGVRMPSSRLFSWREGIGSLPSALAMSLGDVVSPGVTVRGLQAVPGGFKVDAGSSGAFIAKSVVIATQPHVAARMLEGVDAGAASAAGDIDAPPLAVAFFGFKRRQVDHPLDGLGFLAPSKEGCALSGAQFCSTMFPGRAPDGHVSIAAYIGGARAPDLARLPKEELVDLALSEFRNLIGVRGEPVVAQVRHWPLGLPQYRIGHQERTARLEEAGRRHPGLFVTGNYFNGPSVAVCLTLARETAGDVHGFLVGAGAGAGARAGAGAGESQNQVTRSCSSNRAT